MEARCPVFVEFAAFPWIENWQPCCTCIGGLGEDFEKWRKQFVSGQSIERADLKMEETKHVSKQRSS